MWITYQERSVLDIGYDIPLKYYLPTFYVATYNSTTLEPIEYNNEEIWDFKFHIIHNN